MDNTTTNLTNMCNNLSLYALLPLLIEYTNTIIVKWHKATQCNVTYCPVPAHKVGKIR